MTCAIFIKSCERDADYLKHCLASIDKFCTGFSEVKVVLGEHPKGYLQQQVIKCHADEFTDADYVLITDSDTLMTKPVTPETFMRDGKPLWLHTPWNEEMLAHPGTRAWFDTMQSFLGKRPPSEFMRRQGFMIPRWLFKEVRKFCAKHHGVLLDEYIYRAQVFSEFNVLGHFAWGFFHDEFSWIDTTKEELPELVLRQFWSAGDPVEKNLEEIQRILA